MASKCGRFMNRASLSSLKSSIKNAAKSASSSPKPAASPLPRSTSSPLPRFSFSRLPKELGGAQSLLPLHSAVSVARLTSCLSTTSRSARALSQELGLSVPR
ncbi:protein NONRESPONDING TO OXYLIPINS 2, mitochondrial isoform X2 [Spinacia oleracea]|uniref:Protein NONRESPONDING TO OXYLIPINS 2, mitochondrial isoform X2 n=1 Tax=Spinacia oleracea TaxID=3562 RepID=A0A9R0K326_SPIOL|nr:protein NONRESPONDING TO OXYLIPINS 2, mitochondrial-like isoform X2 [Spinacia oleracea]